MTYKGVGRVDLDKAGGLIGTGAKTVFTNNKSTAINSSVITGAPNRGDIIISSQTTVYAENENVGIQGSTTARGYSVQRGSSNVFAGNEPGPAQVEIKPFVPIPPSALFTSPPLPTAKDHSPKYVRTTPPPSRTLLRRLGYSGDEPGNPTGPIINDQPRIKCSSGKPSVIPFLTKCLEEAKQGLWLESLKRTGRNNQNIINIWTNIGLPYNEDTVPWCAGFACFAMKQSGLPFIRGAHVSIADKLAKGEADKNFKAVPVDQMQPGDLVKWGQEHVSFCYSVKDGKYSFVGGNQSDNVTEYPKNWTLDKKRQISLVVRLDC